MTPLWYNLIFLNQTLRLRFKRGLFLGLIRELILNFVYHKNFGLLNYFIQLLMSIIFLRYLFYNVKTFLNSIKR